MYIFPYRFELQSGVPCFQPEELPLVYSFRVHLPVGTVSQILFIWETLYFAFIFIYFLFKITLLDIEFLVDSFFSFDFDYFIPLSSSVFAKKSDVNFVGFPCMWRVIFLGLLPGFSPWLWFSLLWFVLWCFCASVPFLYLLKNIFKYFFCFFPLFCWYSHFFLC